MDPFPPLLIAARCTGVQVSRFLSCSINSSSGRFEKIRKKITSSVEHVRKYQFINERLTVKHNSFREHYTHRILYEFAKGIFFIPLFLFRWILLLLLLGILFFCVRRKKTRASLQHRVIFTAYRKIFLFIIFYFRSSSAQSEFHDVKSFGEKFLHFFYFYFFPKVHALSKIYPLNCSFRSCSKRYYYESNANDVIIPKRDDAATVTPRREYKNKCLYRTVGYFFRFYFPFPFVFSFLKRNRALGTSKVNHLGMSRAQSLQSNVTRRTQISIKSIHSLLTRVTLSCRPIDTSYVEAVMAHSQL